MILFFSGGRKRILELLFQGGLKVELARIVARIFSFFETLFWRGSEISLFFSSVNIRNVTSTSFKLKIGGERERER